MYSGLQFLRGVMILMVLYSTASTACDCTIFPFSPPSCSKTCNTQILNKSSASSLKSVLGLPKPLSEKIVSMRDTAGVDLSQSDIEKNLSADDAKILGQKLGELDSTKVIKLQKTLQKDGKTLN